MNNDFEIDRYNQYNLPKGVKYSTCPLCSHIRKKKYEKCVSLDWKRGLGTCHHCGERIQLHTYRRIQSAYSNTVNFSQNDKQTIIQYLPNKYIPTSNHIEKNNLFRFLASRFKEEDVRSIFDTYHIGISKHWINDDGYSCTFPQIDIAGNLRQLKVIAYNPDTGKRLHKQDLAHLYKDGNYQSDTFQEKVWFAGKTLLDNHNANLKQSFFGEHLLKKSKLPVAIVESEKTALIAAILLPQYTWIATGGKNGCSWTNEGVCEVLTGRTIILFPDLKCSQEWKEKGQILKRKGINISINSYLEKNATQEELEKGLDIADFLLKSK